ncbi:MAG: D-aminoacyl-tRNA deacylase [Candidatus ainarchaeum sp.]|nr:D-aminoacyl-tRNA deacylase [Candidatus ainarchaeum sp.]
MIILFTSNNIASLNIAEMLIGKHGFEKISENEWRRGGVRMIDTKAPTVLEVPTDFKEPILVLSTHKSKTPGKMLTAHVPGNWGEAGLGGEPKTLNIAPASRLKALIIELKKQGDGIGWPVSLEADHHGPTCDTPIMFVEIGNGEEQWRDESAAEAVANAVMASLDNKETYGTVFGAGGGHYSKVFTKLVLETNLAIGHIAPKYAIDGMDEGMFKQAVERGVEQVTKVVIIKDETSAPQRQKIKEFAEKSGLPVEII